MRLLIVKILSQILFLSLLIGQYNASIKTARMYEIQQNKGDNYIVNSKHTLVLKYSGDKSIYWIKTFNLVNYIF